MRRVVLGLLGVALLAAYLASGIYSVDNDESAVGFVLGHPVDRDVGPGVHWVAPWPFGRAVIARTRTNVTMPVGYDPAGGAEPAAVGRDLWMTAGASIVTVCLDVRYTIGSLTDHTLSLVDPAGLVRAAAERALNRFLLAHDVDDVLTTHPSCSARRSRARSSRPSTPPPRESGSRRSTSARLHRRRTTAASPPPSRTCRTPAPIATSRSRAPARPRPSCCRGHAPRPARSATTRSPSRTSGSSSPRARPIASGRSPRSTSAPRRSPAAGSTSTRSTAASARGATYIMPPAAEPDVTVRR